jgi:TolB-like protein/class 3 adenylate cyclase
MIGFDGWLQPEVALGEQFERKLAAILAADIAGYSRLMAADEEGTLSRLKSLRREMIDPKIREYRGRIIKTTGDGILIEFASVVDAVRCAVDVQRGMTERNESVAADRRIEFRVGINIGDVIIEGDDIYGDGVNIAARLENIAEPGGIRVSATVRDHVLDKLGFAFDDMGEQTVKNIPRPVRVYRVQLADGAASRKAASSRSRAQESRGIRRSLPWISVAAAVIVIIAGAGRFAWRSFSVSSPPAVHLSIVVLPFANLSGDPSQDYFADGITDSLTTELSRIRNSFVIARNTAFTYKGKAIDVKNVGKELDVRYVLEGSAQRDQSRVRINVQLVDAQIGSTLWADRFDEDLSDLFNLQDQIVARLANSLGYELTRAEAKNSGRAGNLDAVDLTMRGWAHMWRPINKDDNQEARDLFQHALELDRNNEEAIVGLAYADFRSIAFPLQMMPVANPATEASDLLARATALSPGYAFAYYVNSTLLFLTKRPEEALAAAETAATLNPNLASAYLAMGQTEYPLGQCDQSIAHVRQAFKLSPRDVLVGVWYLVLGHGEFCAGRYDAAIDEFKRSIDAGLRTYAPYMLMAAAYAMMGRTEEAKNALAEAKRIVPNLTLESVEAHDPVGPREIEGLRKAGLP